MHVLIIEDESMIALMMQDYLRDLGYETFSSASSEDEAVVCALSRRPDLIVADFRLKFGTGVDAVRRICEKVLVPTIYVVGVPSDVRGADPAAIVLEKPFMSDDLAKAVRSAQSARLG